MMRPAGTALLLLLLLPGAASAQHEHDHEPYYGYTKAERMEYREAADSVLWDFEGRYGGDYRKFAWKTEGHYAGGDSEEAELQLLYERAWTAWFDLQFGARYADGPGGGTGYGVIGTQGLLPYRIETDIALFLSEDGDFSGRAEFEKDFLLSERLVLQPRLELALALQDAPELDVDAGLTRLSLGLRLRYELTRRFAPYLGVAWDRNNADVQGDEESTTAVAGVRFWF
jgi:copper resistance protein B